MVWTGLYPLFYGFRWHMTDDTPQPLGERAVDVGGDIGDSTVIPGDQNIVTSSANTAGGQLGGRDQAMVNVHVYAKDEHAGGKRTEYIFSEELDDEIMHTIEARLRDKLNEHDVKLARLEVAVETGKANVTDYVTDLRADIAEIKQDLKPLAGLGILAQTSPKNEEEREQAEAMRKTLVIIAIALTVIAVALLLLILFLALGGK